MKTLKNERKNNMKTIFETLVLLVILISNCVIVNATDETVISNENWDKWQEREYWEWYTRTTTNDMAYNGEHIGIEDETITFYGYGRTSYKDFLYREYTNPGKKIFKFILDESKANYHSLDGSGFLFNANKVNNKLSGYVILFKEKTVCLYRLDDVDIEEFQTRSQTTMDTYGELIETINKSDIDVRNLVVEATPTKVKVKEEGIEIFNVNLDYAKHVGESFGLITSYMEHSCQILSTIEFYQLKIGVDDYKISVLNTDLNNKAIQGGSFVFKNENGQILKSGSTDSNGIFSISGLSEGIYTIQQTKQPEGYILNDNIYKFKVTNEGKIVDINTGKEITLIVKNEKIGENSTNSNSVLNTQNDNTRSSNSIPKAGQKGWVVFIGIGIISILGIYFKIRLKQYKIIK